MPGRLPGHGPGRARPARTLRPRARRLGPAARPGHRWPARPPWPAWPGRLGGRWPGRRRAARPPSGRNRRAYRESPGAAGRAGESGSRCGEPAARSTSWSPPPSDGRGRPPAVGAARWPGPGRLAAPARAVAAGGRPAGERRRVFRPWPTGGSPRPRRAAPGRAIRAGIPAAAACRAPGGCGAGRAACRPAGAGRWCGLGSRDRPGRRPRPGWGRAVERPAGSRRRRRLRRPSHARHGLGPAALTIHPLPPDPERVRRAQRPGQPCGTRPAIECRAGGPPGHGRRSIGLIRRFFISSGSGPGCGCSARVCGVTLGLKGTSISPAPRLAASTRSERIATHAERPSWHGSSG